MKQSIDKFINNRKVLVAGLGILGGGIATCQWLLRHNANLTITDLKTKDDLQNSLKKLTINKRKIKLILGRHRKIDFQKNDLIIANPALKFNNPYLQIARKNNKEIENEITLFFRFVKNPVIAVTGTRGKTTTTNWIFHLLKGKYSQVVMGGNIPNKPVLSFLDKLKSSQPIILELSCFQLELFHYYAPHIAIITNLYRDHLNRYKTMKAYARTKANIFLSQNTDDYLILNKDDNWTPYFLSLHPRSQVYFTSQYPLPLPQNGIYQKEDKLYFQEKGKREFIISIKKFRNEWGAHNLNNLIRAILVAKLFGLNWSQIKRQISTLPAIPFREQTILQENKIKIINDSASTSPEAVISALKRFKPNKKTNLILITGGTDKNLNFKLLAQEIKKTIIPSNLILLEGSATIKLIKELKKISYLPPFSHQSLESCWQNAQHQIDFKRNNIILFSPGGSSFEKFKNEFDRGEQFNKLVQNRKIVVGLSGGIDSAAALFLLKQQGWQPIGIFLRLPIWQNKNCSLREAFLSPQESLERARYICHRLNVPFHVIDAQRDFKNTVVKYFIQELKQGQTPNPCMICNPHLKFAQLFTWARKHKIRYVATGHYAKIQKNNQTNQYQLLRAKDKKKDQSYYLAFLPEKWLSRIILPLGDYRRKDTEQLIKKEQLNPLIRIKSSQDFCFLGNCPLSAFLEHQIGEQPGVIKTIKGKILGLHKGLYFYTIGQRRGLNLSGGPYYIQQKDYKNNILIVTKNKKDLLQRIVILSPIHFINGLPSQKQISIKTKTRYQQSLKRAQLQILSKNRAKLIFSTPQESITPGQFAVFYQGDICLGGGKIV